MITSSWILLSQLVLPSGLYHCPGRPEICDQRVRVFRKEGRITRLQVEYVGYCGSMGPYDYFCKGATCSDGNAEFTLTDARGYHWKNLGYPYECDFQRK